MLLFFEVYKKNFSFYNNDNNSVEKILKGQDSFREMYGVIKPEVSASYTKNYDISWVYKMIESGKIYICGEAKDYCVYETVKQLCEIYKNNNKNTEYLHIMMNCCSSIGNDEECINKYKKLSDHFGIKLINI